MKRRLEGGGGGMTKQRDRRNGRGTNMREEGRARRVAAVTARGGREGREGGNGKARRGRW